MRERIMDAALIEFSDKGIKFTMDDVAKRIRISKKTIYNFFKNKEVLLLETIDFGFAEVQKQKKEIVNDKDMDIIDKIKNVLIAIPEKYKGFDWRLIYQISEKYPDAYEKIEEIPIMVIKKDGTREPFNSEKILSGVRKACEKRPVSTADMELLVDNVVREVFNSLEQEVRSEAIGEMVMSRLKDLDEVAYVRFASVYRQFKDINTFMNELKILLGEN